MIGALDNFVQANSYSEEKDIYKHNYAFLCQFSHPSQDSSALFVDAIEENEGHVMQFRWAPDFGDTGIISTLDLLKQSLQIGFVVYYLFSVY